MSHEIKPVRKNDERLQGSFSNSRQKNRPLTKLADTGLLCDIPVAGSMPILVRPANPDRAYVLLRNTGVENLRYGYRQRATLNLDGMLLRPGDAAEVDAPVAIYAVSETGIPAVLTWEEGQG